MSEMPAAWPRASLPSAFDALQAAALEIGSVQIQNTATLVGNLCNASPAADGVPPLLALDAAVELVSASGTRTLPLEAFVLGPRRTARRAAERTPWLVEDAVARGHEIACHGWRWETHAGMDEARERAVIARTHAALARLAGAPPVGWHTRSATSPRTRALLIEHGGFTYDSNAYDDDVPYLDGGHVVLPYAFDTNDMRFGPGGGFVTADDFVAYVCAGFDRLLAEGAGAARMMSIGLHPRIIGRPARIAALERVLAHVAAAPDVWIAPRREIARAWAETHGGTR